MVGRKPKSMGQAAADGDTRKIGARKLAARIASEPKAERGLPDCPEHLPGRARESWDFWSEQLSLMGVDRRPDAQMLEGACVAYGRAVEADELVAVEGLIVCEPIICKGEVVGEKRKAHPAVAVSNTAWKQLRAFCSEFGLSPVSRTRLSTEKKPVGEDDLAKILMQPRAPRPATTVM